MDENAGEIARPAATRGQCPLCAEEFDDVAAFRTHLGDAHQLYDDDGAETEFLPPPLDPLPPLEDDDEIAPASTPVGAAEVTAALAAPPPAPADRRRALPVLLGSAALAGLLVVGLLVTRDGGSSNDASTATTLAIPETTAPVVAVSTPDATVAEESPTTSTITTTTHVVTDAPPVTDSAVAEPAPEAVPDTAPTTEPTPPPAFVAPTATDATIDSCTRQGNTSVVNYSWVFSGGTGWQPGPGESASGGRYTAVFSTPRKQSATITSVVVIDANGQPVNVPLQPALLVNPC